MSLGLFVLGILLSAAGVMMVGFGIPINEFSLGNTLIIAGSSLLAGGAVVIGLAVAVRQLHRIAEALGRASAPRPVRPVEVQEPVVVTGKPVPGKVPMPSRPARPEGRDPRLEQPHRDPRAHEPRVSAGIEPPEEVMVERPRPAPFRNGDQQIVEDSGEVTLSPRPPFRPQMPAPSEPSDLGGETRWPPAPALERLRNSGAAEPHRGGSSETVARATPPSRGLFDSVWPAARNPNPAVPESQREAAEPAPRPAPRRREPEEAHAPQPASVLKSGVVDGMAYTLYTDGSIEAELAEGVVRFASIEELRTHLEKSQ